MPEPKIHLLSNEDIKQIHASALRILQTIGVMIQHPKIRAILVDLGAKVDHEREIIYLGDALIERALKQCGKQYILYGRDADKIARFGYGEQNLLSSPGQYAWIDHRTNLRRDSLTADLHAAAWTGEHLENISIVGAMALPEDIPASVRDVVSTAELVTNCGKPTRCFPVSRRSSRYVLEIYSALAGGKQALCQYPMTEVYLDPISPLKFPENGLDIILEFIEYGQPVCVTPMVMAAGTAPATLAGALVQQHAEILAGITLVQAISPGHPVMYGGIPHIIDPKSSLISFGAPEQGLMAVAMCQMAKYLGLPVYINVNLSDSKMLDLQAGIEKMSGLVLGMMAGADLFGHAGILGADQGASLSCLVADNEMFAFANRIVRGFSLGEEHMAEQVISKVGHHGFFLAEKHTVKHFRDEFWFPGSLWSREPYDIWVLNRQSMEEKITATVDTLISKPKFSPLEEKLKQEIGRIVQSAIKDLVKH